MKNRIILNTSTLLIAAKALAAAANANSPIELIPVEAEAEIQADLKYLLEKRLIKQAIVLTHSEVSKGFGNDGKSLTNKYYGDLLDRLEVAQATTAPNDSTNLNWSGGGLPKDNIAVCHGVCHGNCHGLYPPTFY